MIVMSGLFKKVFIKPKALQASLISFLLLIFLFSTLLVPKTALAAAPGPWYNQGILEWYQKVYNSPDQSEIFGERYTAAQVDWIIYSVFTWLPTKIIGPGFTSCGIDLLLTPGFNLSSCVSGLWTQLFGYSGSTSDLAESGGVKNEKGFLEILFEDRPLSGITYIKNAVRKLGFVPVAKAQGFGFDALDPIQDVWRGLRDVSYGLFVIIALVFAFMIMFRVKISPQVSVTVQSALPRVILGIILVTFSYAIAGLLIDLMYVVIGLISLALYIPFEAENAIELFNWLTRGPAGLGVVLLIIQSIFFLLIGLFLAAISALGGILTGLVTIGASFALAAFFVTGIGGWIIMAAILLIGILLIWHALKIVWTLLKAYANILLLTIFSPLQFTFGLLVPGIGFGAWIKSFISNLAVFVVVGLLFLLTNLFILIGTSVLFGDSGLLSFLLNNLLPWQSAPGAPAGSDYWPPLLGTGQTGLALLMFGTAFVLFTIIPRTADLIKALIQGQPFAYGTAIGEALGPATGAYRYAAPYRQYRIGRSIYDATPDSTIGRTLGRIGISDEQRKSFAQTVFGYRPPG